VPANLAPGTYFLGAIADAGGLIAETNENNNTWNTVQITVTAPSSSDLTASVLSGPATVAAGGNLAIAGDTFNLGSGTTAASTTNFYLSTDATITTADRLIASDAVPALTAAFIGSTYFDHYNFSALVPANLAPGTYFLGAIADAGGLIAETNENNNTWNTVQITVTAPSSSDLTASVLSGPATVAAGGNFTIAGDTFNLGSGTTAASTTNFYLSTDATITTADRLIASDAVPALTAAFIGSTYFDHYNFSALVPANLAPGTYFLGAIADAGGLIAETNENNNTWNTVQITVTAANQTGSVQAFNDPAIWLTDVGHEIGLGVVSSANLGHDWNIIA
jgi:subtilase family serine protease